MLEFIGFIVCTWLGAGFLALVFDWFDGFPKALGNRDSVNKFMELHKKMGNTNPKLTVVTFVVLVFVLSGPFSFLMSSLDFITEE